MRAFTRLRVSAFAMVLSLMTVLTLLQQSRYTEHLKMKIKIGGTSIDDVWHWANGDDGVEGGVRLVVFGDNWVDDRIEENGDGMGRSWTEVLCDEFACSSHINLAASQSASSYPSSPPTGAFASNKIYLSSIENTPLHDNITSKSMLPDLEAQVKSFIAQPQPRHKFGETIFVLSFGTWDIWHYASLDYKKAQEAQNKAVEEIFAQLDTLYAHHRETLEATHIIEKPQNESHAVAEPQFRVVLSKLFDPTMLPGWLSQRPIPLKPSTVAENQKNAIHLMRDWEFKVENSIKPWFASMPEASTSNTWADPEDKTSGDGRRETGQSESMRITNKGGSEILKIDIPRPQKDIYYYDLNRFLTEIMLEHQLEDEGLSDASGLGTKESPYISVFDPCVGDDSGDNWEETGERRRGVGEAKDMKERINRPDINGLTVCDSPDDYLFWDDFSIGRKVKERVGKEIAGMIRQGKSLRAAWGDGSVPGVGF